MASDSQLWRLLPRPVRTLPADLAGVLALVGLTIVAVFTPVVDETPLRIVVGLPFVLFVPGYALIAALFPEDGGLRGEDDTAGSATVTGDSGIDGIDRVALSFGASIAVVPLVSLALNFTPFGVRLVPIVASVSTLTVGFTAVAARRRQRLAPEARFQVPYREWIRASRAELLQPDTRTDAVLNVFVAISVVLAVGTVGYAVAVPSQGESFTEFYLLTETDDGELVADDYPTEFVAGQPESLVVGVENQEYERTSYTVVVAVQRASVVDNETRIRDQRELRRFETELAHNETWRLQHEVTPEMRGEELRLAYFLYRDDPPARPGADSAYRELHLWVNVSAPTTA